MLFQNPALTVFWPPPVLLSKLLFSLMHLCSKATLYNAYITDHWPQAIAIGEWGTKNKWFLSLWKRRKKMVLNIYRCFAHPYGSVEHCLLEVASSCRGGVSLEGALSFETHRLKQSIFRLCCLMYCFSYMFSMGLIKSGL